MPTNMWPCGSSLDQQLSSIMEVLSKAAVTEISQLFSEGSASLRLQISQSLEENEALRSELFSLRLQIKSNAASMENGLQPLNNLMVVGGPPPHPPPDCGPSSVKTQTEQTPNIILIKKEEDLGGGPPAENSVDSGDRSTPCSPTTESPRADAAVSSNMSAHSGELRILSVYGRGEGPLAADGYVTLFTASELEGLRPSLTHDRLLRSNSGPSERVPALDGLQAAALPLEGAAPEAEDPEREPVPLGALSPLQNSLELPQAGGAKSLISRKKAVRRKKQTGQQAGHTKPPVLCVVCGRSFVKKTTLNNHMRIHTGERPFVCVQCGKRFTTSSTLSSHLKTHSGEKPFVCVQCGKHFTRKDSLKLHLKTHSGEKPWACVQCGKHFPKKVNLIIHMRIHSGEKPFVCVQCGKRFTTSSNLSSHLKTHSGEKPFVCVQCGRRFTRKDSLKLHLKTHSGEEPYVCLQCGKRFTSSPKLTKHMKIHSGEKPWACVHCRKRFTTKDGLKIHLRTHSGEKPFVCLHCDARFTQPSSLRRHMKACKKRNALTHSTEREGGAEI